MTSTEDPHSAGRPPKGPLRLRLRPGLGRRRPRLGRLPGLIAQPHRSPNPEALASVRRSNPPHLRQALKSATVILAMTLGFVVASTPGTAVAAPGAAAVNLDVGYLAAGATKRYCFNFNNHSQVGPVIASGTANNYNVIITVVSTDLEYRANYGWVYCATLRNASSSGSLVKLAARASLHATVSWTARRYLAAGSSLTSCYPTTNFLTDGPPAFSAAAETANVVLTTVSTGFQTVGLFSNNYYCATIRNSSSSNSYFTLMGKAGLASAGSFDHYVKDLAHKETGRFCWYTPANAVPVVAAAYGPRRDANLTVVSTDREIRYGSGGASYVYCATIRNAGPSTAVWLMTRAGF